MSTNPSYDQTHWVPVRRRRQLPTYYYHEHFIEMLDFVAHHYGHALRDEHVHLIDDFGRLPLPAQCLYVRLVNRKGRVFAVNRLRYDELGDTRSALQALRDRGWVTKPNDSHFHEVLNFLTKAEISGVLLPSFAGMSRSLRKDELVAFAREHCTASEFMSRLDTDRLLVQRRIDEIHYLLFLYFGRVQDGLSQFTMRDLGVVRTQGFKDSYEPRFNDLGEALEHYFFASRLHRLRSTRADEFADLVAEAAEWPDPNYSGSAALRDKLAYRLGRRVERAGDLEAALRVFRHGESARCSERVIRLLLAAGRRDEAEHFLERCIENPRSDEEVLVALDLYERKFTRKRTSAVTDMLRAAESIDLDEAHSGSPERAAVDHYERQGVQAFRVENTLWRTFFGLLFWEELFVDADATLHSPFEFVPSAVTDGSFYARNRSAIESCLAQLDDRASLKRSLLRTCTTHYGTANGVFRWRRSVIDAMFCLLGHAESEPMREVLRRLCRDYSHARYGYPDLLLIDEAGVRFVEIKTEGDQLRRNQLLRLRQLREAGFRADVVRVRWVLDPNQKYVVVDVETTGGRGEHHRVTEIGAIKLQDGKIVDRFETLLNPQRSIPPNITRLTGITPAMIVDSPYFTDIADDFEGFLQDAIFVAHNVEFDYRFIAQEFRRIGRDFRYPKLCTCASMRRLFPGQKSYSLAALCRAYGIALKHHHRAMCDAEAAAELLILINEKRADALRSSIAADS